MERKTQYGGHGSDDVTINVSCSPKLSEKLENISVMQIEIHGVKRRFLSSIF